MKNCNSMLSIPSVLSFPCKILFITLYHIFTILHEQIAIHSNIPTSKKRNETLNSRTSHPFSNLGNSSCKPGIPNQSIYQVHLYILTYNQSFQSDEKLFTTVLFYANSMSFNIHRRKRIIRFEANCSTSILYKSK